MKQSAFDVAATAALLSYAVFHHRQYSPPQPLTFNEVRARLAAEAYYLPDDDLNNQLVKFGASTHGSKRARSWRLAWQLLPA